MSCTYRESGLVILYSRRSRPFHLHFFICLRYKARLSLKKFRNKILFFEIESIFSTLSVCRTDCLFFVLLFVGLSVCLSSCLSFFLSLCLSVCLFVCLMCVFRPPLSVSPSACFSVRLSIRLSVRLSVHLFICPSVSLSLCLSVCLSVCYPSVFLSVSLSLYLFCACLNAGYVSIHFFAAVSICSFIPLSLPFISSHSSFFVPFQCVSVLFSLLVTSPLLPSSETETLLRSHP